MDPGNFKNETSDGDKWFRQSFFGQQSAQDNSRRSIGPDTSNNKINQILSRGNNTSIIENPPPKQLGFLEKKGKSHTRHHDQRQSRSQSVRGAANISKETRLLKSKMDRLFATYQQTVVASSQSHVTQLESLKSENQHLRVQLGELETETLRQFSELEDCEEVIAAMEERRISSDKEASMWKVKCEKLAKEVVFLKNTIEKYHQRTYGLSELRFRNEKAKEPLSRKELNPNSGTKHDAEDQLGCNKENTKDTLCGCTSGKMKLYVRDNDSASLIAARGVFGNEIPMSFLTVEKRCDDRRACGIVPKHKAKAKGKIIIENLSMSWRSVNTKQLRDNQP